MKTVLEFTAEDGNNCLMISFQSMWRYKNRTKNYPSSSTRIFSEIETTIMFLIEEGDKCGVEMDKILNTKDKSGKTLFSWAARYSEKIALALLERNVIVNTIESDFETPSFQVSSKLLFYFL